MGYDNIAASEFIDPGLTTVDQHIPRLGKIAAGFLLERIEGTAPAQPRVVEVLPEIIVRESTARPRTGGLAVKTRKEGGYGP